MQVGWWRRLDQPDDGKKKCLLRLHCAQPSSQRRHFSSSASEASPDEHKWTQMNKIIYKDKKAEMSADSTANEPRQGPDPVCAGLPST